MLATAQHATRSLFQVIDCRVDIFCTLPNTTSIFKRIGMLEPRQSATQAPLLAMDLPPVRC
jgi:hypothetical protein